MAGVLGAARAGEIALQWHQYLLPLLIVMGLRPPHLLLVCVVSCKCSKLMLQNKEKGMLNWFHPSSMTSSGRYSKTSACSQAIQAAYGVLACDWHDKTGGRQAECFRWLWTCTGVDGISQDCAPPVWALGLAGVLGSFQDAQGTGYYMVNWHCKASCLLVLLQQFSTNAGYKHRLSVAGCA